MSSVEFYVDESAEKFVILEFNLVNDLMDFLEAFGVHRGEDDYGVIKIIDYDFPKPKEDTTINLDLDELTRKYKIEVTDDFSLPFILRKD